MVIAKYVHTLPDSSIVFVQYLTTFVPRGCRHHFVRMLSIFLLVARQEALTTQRHPLPANANQPQVETTLLILSRAVHLR
jgi:hypothetical protein